MNYRNVKFTINELETLHRHMLVTSFFFAQKLLSSKDLTVKKRYFSENFPCHVSLLLSLLLQVIEAKVHACALAYGSFQITL